MKKALLLIAIAGLILFATGCGRATPPGQAVDQETLPQPADSAVVTTGTPKLRSPRVSASLLHSSDTLAYVMKFYEKKIGDCQGGKAPCAVVTMVYPEFVGPASAGLQQAITAWQREHMFTPMYGEGSGVRSPASPEAFTEQVARDLETFTRDSPGYASGWEIERKMRVVYNAPPVLSVEIATYAYTGGAHPNSYLEYANFDTRTGKQITLQDLFPENAREKLNALAERRFRQLRKIPEGARWSDLGFFFKEDRFQLNENFRIGENGLTFYFNPYEIAPYAFGPTELFLALTDIRDLLKKNDYLPPASS